MEGEWIKEEERDYTRKIVKKEGILGRRKGKGKEKRLSGKEGGVVRYP